MAEIRLFNSADLRSLEPASPLQKSMLLSKAHASVSGKTVFLSHSSKDDSLVPAVIALLEKHGGAVYADDFDRRLPDPPNPATAAVLREEIRGCARLVVLATDNSYTSRWIPWELGLGDGFHDIPPNAVLPSTPLGTIPSWLQTQYFHLYPKIINMDASWWVTDPAGLARWPLQQWLTAPVVGRTP